MIGGPMLTLLKIFEYMCDCSFTKSQKITNKFKYLQICCVGVPQSHCRPIFYEYIWVEPNKFAISQSTITFSETSRTLNSSELNLLLNLKIFSKAPFGHHDEANCSDSCKFSTNCASSSKHCRLSANYRASR